jgi:hypothetical protein
LSIGPEKYDTTIAIAVIMTGMDAPKLSVSPLCRLRSMFDHPAFDTR